MLISGCFLGVGVVRNYIIAHRNTGFHSKSISLVSALKQFDATVNTNRQCNLKYIIKERTKVCFTVPCSDEINFEDCHAYLKLHRIKSSLENGRLNVTSSPIMSFRILTYWLQFWGTRCLIVFALGESGPNLFPQFHKFHGSLGCISRARGV